MNIRLLLLCIGTFILLSFAGQERERTYYFHTRKLHRLTTAIQEGLKSITESVENINVETCGKINRPDLIIREEQKLHRRLQLTIIENMRRQLIREGIDPSVIPYEQEGLPYDQKQRVVRSADVIFKNKDLFRKHKSTFEEIEDDASQLLAKVKRYQRSLDRCAKKYARCQQFLSGRTYSKRVHQVKRAAELLQLAKKDNDPCTLKDNVQRTLIDIDNILGPLDDSYTQTLLKALEHELLAINERCGQARAQVIYENERNAHAAWNRVHRLIVNYSRDTVYNQYLERSANCEYDFIQKSSENWRLEGQTINEQWVVKQKEQFTQYGRRGCNMPCADNYTPNEADINDNISCEGCMDPKADNYCKGARIAKPCIYLVCQDTSYWESRAEYLYDRYRPGVDKIERIDSLYITPRFGCMDKLCDNYNPNAIYELKDSCDCCCNDPTAVNYDPNCTEYENRQDVCHWKGCMSKCALNYNPNARSDYPGGSCICDTISEIELEQRIHLLSTANYISDGRTDREMSRDFQSRFQRSNSVTRAVSRTFIFEREDADLKVTSNIKLSGLASDIELGAYWYPPIYQVIDSLVDFLHFEAANYQRRNIYDNLEGFIIGEADNTPINGRGISYSTDGSNEVYGHPVFVLPQNVNTDAKEMLAIYTSLPRMVSTQNLRENSYITDNLNLAFARAFLVKNRLIQSSGRIDASKIGVFIRENYDRGGQYRKIVVALRIKDFFGENEAQSITIANRLRQLKRLRDFYRAAGKFPVAGNTFRSCPCID